jgi:hypothetical protein
MLRLPQPPPAIWRRSSLFEVCLVNSLIRPATIRARCGRSQAAMGIRQVSCATCENLDQLEPIQKSGLSATGIGAFFSRLRPSYALGFSAQVISGHCPITTNGGQ